MAETAQSPSRSSLLFAMGELTSETRRQGKEIDLLRVSQVTLPDKVALALEPRLVAITASVSSLGARVAKVEQKQYYLAGAVAVVIYLVEKVGPLVLPHIQLK